MALAPPPHRAPLVAVVGDVRPGLAPHDTIPTAIAHADHALDRRAPDHGAARVRTRTTWVATERAADLTDVDLSGFAGFWIAPGGPYRSLDGALRVIRHARENDRPLLGTCAGFQHVVLEFARNVLGVADAAHAEYDPYSSHLFVRALSCSLAGRSFPLRPHPATRVEQLYRAHHDPSPTETYYCDFALAPEHAPDLAAAGLTISATDHTGEARAVELTGHRFYLATLFVPQTRSAPHRPHPVIDGFVSSLRRRHDPTTASGAPGEQPPEAGPRSPARPRDASRADELA